MKEKRSSQATSSEENVDPSTEMCKPEAKPAKRPKLQKGLGGAGAASTYENGVVRTIIVENFMNHSHLRVDLDPHVNFIVGKNGSGKSAIVASLIAGLGCRAKSTGRNTKGHASLIKFGEPYALIKIYLANEGDDAYMPDEFGDTIVVEHKLERQGAGWYKLSNADGSHSRKTTKHEIEKLCAHMNIQAANPCALLTQEAAKKFLHHGNEETLYTFFLQAANLQAVQDNLRVTQTSLEDQKAKLDTAKEDLPRLEEIARKAAAEYEGAVALKKLNEQRQELERVLGWACVIEREEELEHCKSSLSGFGEKISSHAEQIKASQQRESANTEKIKAAQEETASLLQQLREIGEKARLEKEADKKIQRQMKAAKSSELEATETVEQEKKALAASERRLETKIRDLEENQRNLQAKHEREKSALEERLSEAKAGIDAREKKVSDLRAEYESRQAEMRRFEAKQNELQYHIKDVHSEIKQLASKSSGGLSLIHPDMPQLVDAVKRNQNKFRVPPVGPLGQFVRLNEGQESFAGVVEMALGGERGLNNFVVFSTEDEETLRKIAQNLRHSGGRVPPLSQLLGVMRKGKEPRYANVARERLLKDVPIVLDLITIIDDDAFNALVDRGADTTYVFANEDAARQALDGFQGLGQVSGICADTFARRFVRCSKASRFTGREPQNRQPRGVLTTDTRALVDQRQQQLEKLQKDVAAIRNEATAYKRQTDSITQGELAIRKELKGLQDHAKKFRNDLQRLQTAASSNHFEQEIEELKNDAEDTKRRIEAAENQREQHQALHQRLVAEHTRNQDKRGDEHNDFTKVSEQYERKKAQIEQLAGPQRKAVAEQRKLQKELDNLMQNKRQAEAKAQELEQALVTQIPQVEDTYGERVVDPKRRPKAELEAAWKQAVNRQKKQEAKHGGRDINELKETAVRMEQVLHDKQEELSIAQRTCDGTEEQFKQRYHYWRKSCKLKGKQAASDFNMRLSTKGHAGDLHFDHEKEKLSLEVTRNSQDTGSASTTDARNLSGGERSFTTLAFELSMWEFCETPFRVLDEFDVYMDDTYRQIAVDTLLQLCDEQPRRQFLFITPQDMHPFLSNRTRLPRIIRMNDVR